MLFFQCVQEYVQLRSEPKSQYYHNLLLIKVKKTIIYYFHSINSIMVFFWFWFGLDLVFCLGKNVKNSCIEVFLQIFFKDISMYCIHTYLCMSVTHINLTDAKAEKEKKNPSMNFMQIALQQVFYVTLT